MLPPRVSPVRRGDIPDVNVRSSVAVVTAARDSAKQRLTMLDYYMPDDYAEDIGRVFVDALKAMDVTVVDKAEKTVTLTLHELKFIQGMVPFRLPSATVQIHVTTESGYERVFEGFARTAGKWQKSIYAAAGRAVTLLLKDEEFIEYLSE